MSATDPTAAAGLTRQWLLARHFCRYVASRRRSRRPAAGSAPALDPCTIIPTSRLARLIDARLSQRGPARGALGQQCAWDFPDPGGVGVALTITAWRGEQSFSAGSIGEPLADLGGGLCARS